LADSNLNQVKKKHSSLWWPFGRLVLPDIFLTFKTKIKDLYFSRTEGEAEHEELKLPSSQNEIEKNSKEIPPTESLTINISNVENQEIQDSILDEAAQKERFKKTLRLSSSDIVSIFILFSSSQ